MSVEEKKYLFTIYMVSLSVISILLTDIMNQNIPSQ